jgi:putative endonuclease
MADPRHDFGLRAEAAVATWLERDGWTVLERRWRVAEGEIDLVCLDPGSALVGVEVRARRSGRSGSPLESVGSAHVRRLRAALGRYAATSTVRRSGIRLDLVGVVPDGDGRWRLTRQACVDGW